MDEKDKIWKYQQINRDKECFSILMEKFFEDFDDIPDIFDEIHQKNRLIDEQRTERILELASKKKSKKVILENREICRKRKIRRKCFPEKKFFWKLNQRQCPTMNEFSPGIAEYH
jgi:hypothetical protein